MRSGTDVLTPGLRTDGQRRRRRLGLGGRASLTAPRVVTAVLLLALSRRCAGDNVEQRQTFRKGETMTIRGYIPLGAFRFAIEIGHSDEDLALHFNPRFSGSHIVLNSRQKWSWGQEQRETNFPFQPGKEFKMSITHKGSSFEIELPGGKVIHFPNRLGVDAYSYVTTQFDIQIISIKVFLDSTGQI